ncbi:MAG: exodeoxyribonuclease I [Hahellaceae bacterium]|nr:exodeoxyribonuclease I [Hahellaceae bacterium]MCP5212755.1 exodeoxyribonuclease I [Hahellaceae bacterium]
METFLWHDYETFGANPAVDRPSQFAAIRTDFDLNIIGEPIQLYCKPSDDYLPQPEACLITGITPQDADRDGYIEADFIRLINDELSIPLTCTAGYNSIRFDDEVTRHLLYRNFYDPYAREWQNGNSRWDIIDLVRLVYAVRPESLTWPTREDGQVSFRLEELTACNGIAHESAHDAMSDVYATIALAKLIKTRCPDLYTHALSLRDKRFVKSLFDTSSFKPVFHISSMYPASLGCCAVVAPLAEHPVNKNGVIVFDLRHNPDELISLSVDEIKRRIFTPAKDLGEDEQRLALKVVHTNKCPIVTPMALTTEIAPEYRQKHELIGDVLRENLAKLKAVPDIGKKISQVFMGERHNLSEPTDPEQMLYSGGFFGHNDKTIMSKITTLDKSELQYFEATFSDERLPELFFRYKARNYPDLLTEEEHEQWESYRTQRLHEGDSWRLSLQKYAEELTRLAKEHEGDNRAQIILEDLKLYAESIMPYG